MIPQTAPAAGSDDSARRRMAVERDDAAYEMLKREYSRLTGEVTKARAELVKATAALSSDEELSVDEEVESAIRIARHPAVALREPDNREEACDAFRRRGLQIGLTFGSQKFGPKRIVRRLKGGVVVYGDAKLPAVDRPASVVTDVIAGPAVANPFARALLAAVDPNARKEARKSLDRRQAVDTTSTVTSGKPGRKTAGGLTKEKSFGRATSSGRT